MSMPFRLVYWVLLNVAAMWAAVMVVPAIRAPRFTDILWAGVMLALVNGTLGPVLRLFTCPFRLMTLGLFSIIVNWLLFLFAAWLSSRLGASIVIGGVLPALAGALVAAIVVTVGDHLTRPTFRGRRRS